MAQSSGRLGHRTRQLFARPARSCRCPPRGRQNRAPQQQCQRPSRGEQNAKFPDIAALAKLPARTLVLDGELAIYDEQLRSRFEWLREPDPDAVATPPLYMAFDLLYRDARDLSARPLRDRRARLKHVVAGSELVFPVRRLAPDGLVAWKQVIERGYESYVAKDEGSVYEGGPTRRWLKVKQKGWTDAEISGGGPSSWSGNRPQARRCPGYSIM